MYIRLAPFQVTYLFLNEAIKVMITRSYFSLGISLSERLQEQAYTLYKHLKYSSDHAVHHPMIAVNIVVNKGRRLPGECSR